MKKIVITVFIIILIINIYAFDSTLKNTGLSFLMPGLGLIDKDKKGYTFLTIEGVLIMGVVSTYLTHNYYNENAIDFASITLNKNISLYPEYILSKMEYYESSEQYNELLSSKARDLYPNDSEKQLQYIIENTIPDSLNWEWDSEEYLEQFYSMRKSSRYFLNTSVYIVSAIAINHFVSTIFTYFELNKKNNNIKSVYYYDGHNYNINISMEF